MPRTVCGVFLLTDNLTGKKTDLKGPFFYIDKNVFFRYTVPTSVIIYASDRVWNIDHVAQLDRATAF